LYQFFELFDVEEYRDLKI